MQKSFSATFYFKDFICFYFRETAHKQGEEQAACKEPDVGLDPGSPGSHPGMKVALNR